MKLSNKTVLITGANGGVGRELVRYCVEHDARKIYCCARDIGKLDDLKKMGEAIELCPLDITDKAEIQKLSSAVDTIDILINNAGVNSGKRVFDEVTIDFDVNVLGTLNVCRELRHKIAQEGAIVNITSILALVNLPVMGFYSASKSALHSLTQAMRAELAQEGTEVYEVLPGPIDTDMTKDQEMEKTAPEDIVKALFEGYANKIYEIYPDPFSKMIKAGLDQDAKAVERDFAFSVQ
jgi:NAD(P)-dependent dehydrogenase (short-subunit alcohol dehydrogenase family)